MIHNLRRPGGHTTPPAHERAAQTSATPPPVSSPRRRRPHGRPYAPKTHSCLQPTTNTRHHRLRGPPSQASHGAKSQSWCEFRATKPRRPVQRGPPVSLLAPHPVRSSPVRVLPSCRPPRSLLLAYKCFSSRSPWSSVVSPAPSRPAVLRDRSSLKTRFA